MSDDLQRALDSLIAIAGRDKALWKRIDEFVREHRPGQKQGRPKGVTDFAIKSLVVRAYENAPKKEKLAKAQAVLDKFGGEKYRGVKLTHDQVAKFDSRLFKNFDDLSEFLSDHLKKGDT